MTSCGCKSYRVGGETFDPWERKKLIQAIVEKKHIADDVAQWRDVVLRDHDDDDDEPSEESIRDRVVPMFFTKEIRDRDLDIISVRGMDVKRFRSENPVVPFGHNTRDLPIGRAAQVKKRLQDDPKSITGDVMFLTRDLNPLADTVFRLMTMKPRVLNAGSVGFRTIEAEFDQDFLDETGHLGILFTKTELLEFSIVPVPSNPEALIAGKSAGVDLDPLKNYLEENLDHHQGSKFARWITVKDLESCYTVCNRGARTILVPDIKTVLDARLAEVEGKDGSMNFRYNDDGSLAGIDFGEKDSSGGVGAQSVPPSTAKAGDSSGGGPPANGKGPDTTPTEVTPGIVEKAFEAVTESNRVLADTLKTFAAIGDEPPASKTKTPPASKPSDDTKAKGDDAPFVQLADDDDGQKADGADGKKEPTEEEKFVDFVGASAAKHAKATLDQLTGKLPN